MKTCCGIWTVAAANSSAARRSSSEETLLSAAVALFAKCTILSVRDVSSVSSVSVAV